MAVQIINNQIADSAVDGNKLASGAVSSSAKLADNVVAYAKINSSDIETSLSGGASKLASASAIKSYVDAAIPDSFAGGDGISITDGAGTDTIAVDLSTTPGLEFDTAKLQVKLKAESGGTISKDASGLYIADSAIANGKLANSTISGVALGSNLNSLSAGNGISMTSYNGSASVSDLTLALDGGTLSNGASGVKVADGGVDTTQLADSGVTLAKINFGTQVDSFTGDGVATTFDLSNAVVAAMLQVLVFRNGLALEQVVSSPSGVDQFTLNGTGGTGGVGRLTFGTAPSASDSIVCFYIA